MSRGFLRTYFYKSKNARMIDIIIIGGGVAGLVSAKILSAKGKKVLLLEARNQVGGRIQSVDDFSYTAEGGAEFIHGNLKTTFDLLKEAGLKKERLKGKFCRVKDGKWKEANNLVPHWDLLMKKMKACEEDISVDDFLKKSFKAKKYETLRSQFRKYVEGYDAADPSNTSIVAIREEMENEDEDQYRPLGGYSPFINFLKENSLQNGCIIKIGEPVLKVSVDKIVEVLTPFGNYHSEKLIVAVPLGVLQCTRKAKSFIELPSFLNEHLQGAKQMGNGGVIKFLLEFDKAFWLHKDFLNKQNIPAPSYIFADTIIPTWWTQYPSKAPLLTGWIAGPSSYKMKNYSEKKFKQILLASLSSIFSMPPKVLERRLMHYQIMNWIKEPHILGGYSYPTLKTKEAQQVLQKPYNNTVYFAGEYLAKNSSSTVDAALQSGMYVAEQILNDK